MSVHIPYHTKVEFHPYRTASVADIFLEVDRDSVADLEKALLQEVGERGDNHVTFGLIKPDGTSLYIKFSDFSARFGGTLVRH